MRRLPARFCTVAALFLPLGACVPMDTLAEPVSLSVVRSAAVRPVEGLKAHATVIHTPIGLSLHKEAKEALQWETIDWVKQDVLIVHLDQPGSRLGDLRIKGYTLFVPLVAGEGSGGTTCLVAVVEKSRATNAVVETTQD